MCKQVREAIITRLKQGWQGAGNCSAPEQYPNTSLLARVPLRIRTLTDLVVLRMTPSTQLDFLDLSHRPDLGIVAARWTRPTASHELRAGYHEMLRYAASCANCTRWLIDARRRVQVDLRDVHWLTEEFYPTLRQHLNAHVYVAFLIAPYQAGHVHDDSLPALPYTHGDYCSLNQFVDEGEAVRWLVSRQA